MIDVEDFITLVIHTPERAQVLKNILDRHKIECHLEDFISYKTGMCVAQRVKIRPKDLPLALKIIESGESYSPAVIEMKMAGMSGNLLIPVDFSSSSLLSVKIGFRLAARMSVHPVVLHSYVAPMFPINSTVDDSIVGESDMELAADAREAVTVRDIASKKLNALRRQIKEQQEEGLIPDMKFSVQLLEGVAEETILNYCRVSPPAMVVMATRGVDRKEEDLIGSVTAEVLDSCRVPVFTVPENCTIEKIEDVRNLILFCNMDQHDIFTIDGLMRMFDYPECNVVLVPAVGRYSKRVKEKMAALKEYFDNNYPTARFKDVMLDNSDYRSQIDRLVSSMNIQLLIVPNKKTNVFSRIFHPTMAHKFLFERDMPMLVLPV